MLLALDLINAAWTAMCREVDGMGDIVRDPFFDGTGGTSRCTCFQHIL